MKFKRFFFFIWTSVRDLGENEGGWGLMHIPYLCYTFYKKCSFKYGHFGTADTVLLEAYEESRPAKKPNRPPGREPRKFWFKS